MSTRIIPLPKGQAHFRFSVELNDVRLRLRFDWLDRFGYYVVRIERNNQVVKSGVALHPRMDLLRHLKLGIGKLYLVGKAPTLANIGTRNQLVFEEAEGD